MRRLVGISLIFALCLGSISKVYGYDDDMHFQITRAILRFVGIKAEVADALAAGAQYTDEHSMTSPMKALPFLWSEAKRQLYHFHADAQSVPAGAYDLAGERLFAESQIRHPLAYEMITKGMKTGNYLLVMQGLHAVADAHAHSGFTVELGHAEFGHDPDAPWNDPELFKDAIKELMLMATRIREFLPESAIDSSIASGGKSHKDLQAKALSEKFLANERLNKFINNNIFNDSRYVGPAVKVLLEKAKKAGYIRKNVDIKTLMPSREKLAENRNIREVLREIIFKAAEDKKSDSILDREVIYQKLLTDYPPEYVHGTPEKPLEPAEELERLNDIVDRVIVRLTRGIIPEPFHRGHKVEVMADMKPGDGKMLRDLEMGLRNSDAQAINVELFGERPKYVSQISMKDRIKNSMGWAKPEAQVELPANEFSELVGEYKVSMPWLDGIKFGLSAFPNVFRMWRTKLGPLTNKLTFGLLKRGPYIADHDNYRLRADDAFERLVNKGTFMEILSEEQYEKMAARRESAHIEAGIFFYHPENCFGPMGKIGTAVDKLLAANGRN